MAQHILPFARAEYLDRLARTRAAMEKGGIDLMLVFSPENILWLTGYQAKGIFSFQVVMLPLAGDVRLVTRAVDAGNASCMPDDAVIDDYEIYGDTAPPVAVVADLVRSGYAGARRLGVEKINPFLGVARFDALTAALDGHEFVDASLLIDRVRLVKSRAEIECFRKSAAITDAAMLDTIAAVQIGASDREIAAVSLASLMRHGSDYCSTWPNVMVGWRGGLGHAAWDGTVVAEGEPTVLEFAASVQRYHAPAFRSVIPGKPEPEIARAADCVVEAHDAALAALGPGKTMNDLDSAVRKVVKAADCERYAHGRFGYSLGLSFPPTWAQSLSINIVPGSDETFDPGVLFHVLVYLLEPATFGVATSNTVLITETGFETLTKSPKAPIYI
ncbi:MAG: aminopeptidase P family protein [Rhodospirillaceae bacterium]|nr:aminopeptidase P family protein [Rhodospirillaceae bacterium]